MRNNATQALRYLAAKEPDSYCSMRHLAFLLTCVILFGCATPAEKLKEMPAMGQRNVLAELGRDALVEALREVESRTPVSFLRVENGKVKPIQEIVQRETLFRSAVKRTVGHKFEGVIFNDALVADFKDPKVVIYYVAENGSTISSEELILYRTIPAGKSEAFSAEIKRPDQTHSYRFQVIQGARVK